MSVARRAIDDAISDRPGRSTLGEASYETRSHLYWQIRLYFRLQLPPASLVAKYVHLVALAAGT